MLLEVTHPYVLKSAKVVFKLLKNIFIRYRVRFIQVCYDSLSLKELCLSVEERQRGKCTYCLNCLIVNSCVWISLLFSGYL